MEKNEMMIMVIIVLSAPVTPSRSQEASAPPMVQIASPSLTVPPSSAFVTFLDPAKSPTFAGAPESGESSTNCQSTINTECFPLNQNAEQLVQCCCPPLRDALKYDKSCFCLTINNQLLSRCGISGSKNSLCSANSTTVTSPNTRTNALGPTYSNTQTTANSTTVTSPNTRTNAPGPTYGNTQTTGSKIGIGVGVTLVVIGLVVSLVVGIVFMRRKRNSKSKEEKITSSTQKELENQTQTDLSITPFLSPYSSYVPENQMALTQVQSHIPVMTPVPSVLVESTQDDFLSPEYFQYDFAALQDATNNFSRENKIGRGGFGIVYKGLLPNGQQIALKRLLNGSGQGDREFRNEIVVLTKLQHRNLVKLLGFCLTDDDALLVYEFVTNKSLDYFLFDNKRREELNWSCRLEIIKGIAKGMMYLHEDAPIRTVHRDLKAANVLLDAEMCPKIADFGLARICDIDQTHINPTRVVGTLGYMPPEYLFHGQFSAKSDVYAFGVLILEIMNGKRITSSHHNQLGGESLLSQAWRCWEDENPVGILDPIITRNSFAKDEVIKCVHLGLLCVQEDSNVRPTMSTIVHMLNPYAVVAALAMPQQPAFLSDRGTQQSRY